VESAVIHQSLAGSISIKTQDIFASLAFQNQSLTRSTRAKALGSPLESATFPLKTISDHYVKQTTKFLSDQGIEMPGPKSPFYKHYKTSPALRQLTDRLLEGYQLHVKTPIVSFHISRNHLIKLRTELQAIQSDSKRLANQLLNNALTLANREPSNPKLNGLNKKTAAAIQYQLSKSAGIISPITLEDMLIAYLQRDMETLIEKNPFLRQGELNKLSDDLSQYMMIDLKVRQAEEALALLKTISFQMKNRAHKPKVKDSIQKLGEILSAQRHYNYQDHPEMLVFEHQVGFLIRESNAHKIQQLIQTDDNLILQSIMGSGKTEVILPLLGFYLADGKHLPVIVLPPSVFDTNKSDLVDFYQGIYKKKIHTLKFNRQTNYSSTELANIYKNLVHAIKDREILIINPKTAQSLMLKFILTSHVHSSNAKTSNREEISKQTEQLQNILKLLHEKGIAIIDEIDTVMNCRHELNYTIGSAKSINPERWQLAQYSFKALQTNPAIRKHFKIEENQGLSTQVYHQTIKPHLADHLLNHPDFNDNKFIQKHKKEFYNYLCGDPKYNYIIDEFLHHLEKSEKRLTGPLKSLNKKHKDFRPEHLNNPKHIALWEKMVQSRINLNKIIPFTLSKICDVKYGFSSDPNIDLIIPFLGSMVPSLKSIFGHPDVIIFLTLQAMAIKGIPISKIKKLIDNLKERLDHEADILNSEHKSANITFKRWVENTDLNQLQLEEIAEDDQTIINQLHHILTHNQDTIFTYLDSVAFPKIEQHQTKISSNPLDIGGSILFKRRIGFSGTLQNAPTYSDLLTTQIDLSSDGKMVELLNREENRHAQTIHHTDPSLLMQELQLSFKDFNDYKALIDVGALFKGIPNHIVAQKLLGSLDKDIDTVVYFDDKKNQMVELNRYGEITDFSETKTPMDRRFTYYDQVHTTGINVPQAQHAKAFITIGNGINARDIFQGSMRMRNLGKGQSLTFLVPSNIHLDIQKTMMKSMVAFPEILFWSTEQMSDTLEKDVFFSGGNKMTQVVKERAWEKLLSTKQKDSFHRLLEYFIEDNTENLWDNRHNEEQQMAEIVLNLLKKKIVSNESDLLHLDDHQRIEKIKNHTISLLPKMITSGGGGNVANEQEQEQEKEVEMEMQTLTDEPVRPQNRHYRSLKELALAVRADISPASLYLTNTLEDRVIEGRNIFPSAGLDKGILLTENFLRSDYALIEESKNQKIAEYFLEAWIDGGKTCKTILLSRDDMSIYLNLIDYLNENRSDNISEIPRDFTLCLKTNQGEIFSHLVGFSPKKLNHYKEQTDLALVQLKFINGELSYTNKQFALLQQWISSGTHKQRNDRKEFFEHRRKQLYLTDSIQGSLIDKAFKAMLHKPETALDRKLAKQEVDRLNSLNARTIGFKENLDLTRAVHRRNPSKVKAILDSSYNKKALVNTDSATAEKFIEVAVQHNSLEITKLLMSAGARVTGTCLLIAYNNRNTGLIQVLNEELNSISLEDTLLSIIKQEAQDDLELIKEIINNKSVSERVVYNALKENKVDLAKLFLGHCKKPSLMEKEIAELLPNYKDFLSKKDKPSKGYFWRFF